MFAASPMAFGQGSGATSGSGVASGGAAGAAGASVAAGTTLAVVTTAAVIGGVIAASNSGSDDDENITVPTGTTGTTP
ncbi:hypothetical protein S4A8_17564 [Salinisphaera sp. S4-8]